MQYPIQISLCPLPNSYLVLQWSSFDPLYLRVDSTSVILTLSYLTHWLDHQRDFKAALSLLQPQKLMGIIEQSNNLPPGSVPLKELVRRALEISTLCHSLNLDRQVRLLGMEYIPYEYFHPLAQQFLINLIDENSPTYFLT